MKSIFNKKICIVYSTYSDEINQETLSIVKSELKKKHLKKIEIIKVPGSFEIPVTISRLIKKYDAFIAIGTIVKGETNNFELISNAITNGIMKLSIENKKPIGNAIITAFNKDQAKKRTIRGQEAVNAIIDVLKNETKSIK